MTDTALAPAEFASFEFDCVFVADGRVYAHGPRAPEGLVSLAVGAAAVAMQPCDARALSVYEGALSWDLSFDGIGAGMQCVPPVPAPGSLFEPMVGQLPDWTVAGGDTLPVKIIAHDRPLSIALGRDLDVTARGRRLGFRALIATHRAEADLVVTFADPEHGKEEVHRVAFDRRVKGGPSEAGHQLVELPLPDQMARVQVSLTLDFHRYDDPGDSGAEPFLFVSNVAVVALGEDERKGGRPRHVLGTGLPAGGSWVSALLPAIPGPGDLVRVIAGQTQIRVDFGPLPELRLIEDHGHALVFECSLTARLILCIDGMPVAGLSASAGHWVLPLPASHLDGQSHHLALRDASGSVPCWQMQALLPAVLTPATVMQKEGVRPFPDALFPQTGRRYRALKRLLAEADTGATDLAQAMRALEALEKGAGNIRLAPLSFPRETAPDVSVVIPAQNKVDLTYLALCSLLLAPNRARFEVIVVDDASSDDTARLEEIVDGITVIRNETPQRFIRACNAGVAAARGGHVVLLNNDVEVTEGWLDALLDAFIRFDRVGVAGSRLISPAGRLQGAGGIVWGNGNLSTYGHGQNPEDPRFTYARQGDFVPGAAMMVAKPVWDELGGLSSYLEPMCFEDADFAFKARAAGYTTWYVPSSVVYHGEEQTGGTDSGSDFKRFQEINRPKFRRRWAQVCATGGREGQNPDREKDRGILGRVLFIDLGTPRTDLDAGSVAAVEEMRLVQSLGYKVTFLPQNLAHLGGYTDMLQKMGVEVLYAPFHRSAADYIARHGAEFDLFYITRYHVARDTLPHIRAAAPHAPVMFNNADLHFLRELRAARVADDPDLMARARRTREAELAVIEQVDVVLSYNPSEHAVIEAYTEGRARVMRCPWVVSLPAEVPGLATRAGLSFLGGYNHLPNREAMRFFVGQVVPLLAGAGVTAPLSIYGSGLPDEIRAMASPMVLPLGYVETVAEAFDRHRVFVAPLLSGAGIKGKVLSALAHGIPCVLSPVAAEGIGLRPGQDCLIAERPEDWVAAIARLTSDDALWYKLSQAGRRHVAEAFSFEQGRAAMRRAFEAAGIYLAAE